MTAWLLAATALAGNIYVNDVHVNPQDLQGITLEKVDVRIDAAGDVRITAPGYKIEVVNAAPAAPPPSTYPATQGAGQGNYPAGAYGNYGAPPPAAAAPAASLPPPLDPNVPAARWWLVTEDNGTTGHVVEVWINGRLAETVSSGEQQRILDIGRHLKMGNNEVRISSDSSAPTGGSLFVYIGSGGDQNGTVVMDTPAVQFGVGQSRTGAYERSYTLTL